MNRAGKVVFHLYIQHHGKHQHFISYTYQAKSWHREQQCYVKIESTGKGLNTRHTVSDLPEKDAREIYFEIYVIQT